MIVVWPFCDQTRPAPSPVLLIGNPKSRRAGATPAKEMGQEQGAAIVGSDLANLGWIVNRPLARWFAQGGRWPAREAGRARALTYP